MRYFNTAGPCHPDEHYMIDPEPRLPGVHRLLGRNQYFVVHAPRQSGKTTTLLALTQELTATGQRAALYVSCGLAAVAGDDYASAELQLLAAIGQAAAQQRLPQELRPPHTWEDGASGSRIGLALATWAQTCPLPIVLFLDEIDALAGASLISVLQQIRDGYPSRPRDFPASVVLCGLRDVRDYKAASGGDPTRLGTASPFNIKVESFRIRDFTQDQVRSLYAQHTADTGQEFTSDAVERAFCYTQGQPWLVNAIAAEIVDKMEIQSDITAAHVDEAKERLILARATHLDSLVARLNEPRVRKVIEPIIAGQVTPNDTTYTDDVSYVRDLGLVREGNPVTIANPIYREVIVRVLASGVEQQITASPQRFLLPDGRLDMRLVLQEFTSFWRENGEIVTKGMTYHETAPQLVLMAYLQRIVNGGAIDGKRGIDREYGVGLGRIDLLIRKPYGDGLLQREALELKVWRPETKDPIEDGLRQLGEYLDGLGLDTGTLVIFDRRYEAPSIPDRIEFSTAQTPGGQQVTVLRG
jgi:hypothetical protein